MRFGISPRRMRSPRLTVTKRGASFSFWGLFSMFLRRR